MKPETKARKEKMKKALAEVETIAKKEGKKLSTAQKNKMMLDLLVQQKQEVEEIQEEKVIKHKEKVKSFKCPVCGISVKLYGEAEQDKCSKCLNEEIA